MPFLCLVVTGHYHAEPVHNRLSLEGMALLPVPRDQQTFIIAGDFLADCRPRPSNSSKTLADSNAYRFSNAETTGVVTQNVCGKASSFVYRNGSKNCKSGQEDSAPHTATRRFSGADRESVSPRPLAELLLNYFERTTRPTMTSFVYQTATSSLSGQLQNAA